MPSWDNDRGYIKEKSVKYLIFFNKWIKSFGKKSEVKLDDLERRKHLILEAFIKTFF